MPQATFPISGSSDIDLDRLGRVSLAYSPASRDSERPGVQVVHYASRGYDLLFGNAFSRQGSKPDAGVFFTVWSADSSLIAGYWKDGGRGTPISTGYFCAYRLH